MNVLAVSPGLTDSVSWWRLWGPLAELAADRHEIKLFGHDLQIHSQIPWTAVKAASVVWMNRPYAQGHHEVQKMAGTSGIPTIVDFDDLVWDITRGNPAHDFYDEAQFKAAEDCSKYAAICTTTTPHLAQVLADKGAKEVVVIPNALPDWYTWIEKPRTPTIVWRGGPTHTNDIYHVRREFRAALDKHPDFHLHAFGMPPWALDLPDDRYSAYEMMPLPNLHQALINLAPTVFVVPLVDNDFNKCKSNISWIEATMAGAVCIAPDYPEFRKPGCIRYTPGNLGDVLDDVLSNTDKLTANVEVAREYIDTHLRLSTTNRARLDILKRVQ